MTNRNSSNINIPEAREAMDKFKMEAANEVGVNLKQGKGRHVGISFHDSAEMLDRILTEYPQLEALPPLLV